MRARLIVVSLIALAACRAAPAPRETPRGGFPSELGRPATSLSASASASASGRATPSVRPSSSASASTSPSASPAVFTLRASASDASGDAGAKTPAYADMVRLVLESDGMNARLTVTMADAVRDPMPSGEEEAVGIDMYRTDSQQESDYQLYASGDASGWAAFLDTPSGFVRYPGTLQIGGARLVFTVPWSSLGRMRSGYARAFTDWDRTAAVLNDAGEDHAPDSTRLRYR